MVVPHWPPSLLLVAARAALAIAVPLLGATDVGVEEPVLVAAAACSRWFGQLACGTLEQSCRKRIRACPMARCAS